MDGQAGLHLCCSQTPEDRFSHIETHSMWHIITLMHISFNHLYIRVKSGNLSCKFGQWSCLFHTLIIGMQKCINKANSENPDETAHKEPSYQDFHCLQMYVQIYLMSAIT